MSTRLITSLSCVLMLSCSYVFADSQQRLQAVKIFADTVLEKASDKYHGDNPSPLLADGIDPITGQQMEWIFPDGHSAVLSNFATQQNFMRVLVGLSNLTNDPKYKNKAEEITRYYFNHYQDESGLLIWGGHRFVDLKTLQPEGPSEKELVHELKNAYPYYELMFSVNKNSTINFIHGFWNAHVYNWETLETSRHGEYGKPMGRLWANEFTQQSPFFATKGLSFLNAGNDLIYSAALLSKFNNQPEVGIWAKRLAEQYVLPRDKKTGLGVYQFTQPIKRAETTDDTDTHSKYGDRAQRQFGAEFGESALEGNMLLKSRTSTLYSENALMQLHLAHELGKEGLDFKKWTLDGLKAFAKYAYDEKDNTFRPMLANGTDLSNYVLPRDGYYGEKGKVLKPYQASSHYLLTYARAYVFENNDELWRVIKGITKSEGLGDIGNKEGQYIKLNMSTDNNDPYVIFSLIDLWHATDNQAYLNLAQKVADNILQDKYLNGFFIDMPDKQYVNIDNIAPYALLALEAILQNIPDAIPPFINGSGFTEGAYLMPNGSVRISTRDEELFILKKGESLQPNGKK